MLEIYFWMVYGRFRIVKYHVDVVVHVVEF